MAGRKEAQASEAVTSGGALGATALEAAGPVERDDCMAAAAHGSDDHTGSREAVDAGAGCSVAGGAAVANHVLADGGGTGEGSEDEDAGTAPARGPAKPAHGGRELLAALLPCCWLLACGQYLRKCSSLLQMLHFITFPLRSLGFLVRRAPLPPLPWPLLPPPK